MLFIHYRLLIILNCFLIRFCPVEIECERAGHRVDLQGKASLRDGVCHWKQMLYLKVLVSCQAHLSKPWRKHHLSRALSKDSLQSIRSKYSQETASLEQEFSVGEGLIEWDSVCPDNFVFLVVLLFRRFFPQPLCNLKPSSSSLP